MSTRTKNPTQAVEQPRTTATAAPSTLTPSGGATGNAASVAAIDGAVATMPTGSPTIVVGGFGFAVASGSYRVELVTRARSLSGTQTLRFAAPGGSTTHTDLSVGEGWQTHTVVVSTSTPQVVINSSYIVQITRVGGGTATVEFETVRVNILPPSGGEWSAAASAIGIDLVGATHTPTAISPGTRLFLTSMDGGSIPNGDEIQGLKIVIVARTANPGSTYASPKVDDGTAEPGGRSVADVCLTLDGEAVGAVWRVYLTDAFAVIEVGGPGQLFGRAWTAGEVSSSSFGVAVRRSAYGTIEGMFLDGAQVIVYHNPGGPSLTNMSRNTTNEKCLVSPEATPGAGGGTFQKTRELNFSLRPNSTMKEHTPQGEKLISNADEVDAWSTGSIGGTLGYNESPLLFEGAVELGVHDGTGLANQRNIHSYYLETRRRSSVRTYEFQRGDVVTRNGRAKYGYITGVEVGITARDCTVSGGLLAYPYEDGITMATGQTEVQTITITGTPTGGTYRLSYKGKETTDISYNAAASAVQSALQGLTTIGVGNVLVAGTGPYVATFAAALAGTDAKLIRLSRNNLTGGSSPSVVVTQTTGGGWLEYPPVQVLPKHWKVYVSDTYAGLAAGKLNGLVATGFAFGSRFSPHSVIDRDIAGYAGVTEADPTFGISLSAQANTEGMAFLTQMKAGTTRFIRMEAVGPMIGNTSDPHKMIFESAFKVTNPSDFGDEEDIVVAPFDCAMVEGPNGEVPLIIVENGIPTYG